MSALKSLLYVEDNAADVGLLREAISDLDTSLEMLHAQDGDAALAILRDPERAREVGIVILDLNLPRKSGYEVLEELSGWDPAVVPPVAVLTTGARERDVRAAARGMPVRFLTKPLEYDAFVDVVQRIRRFLAGELTLDEI